jgi:hypothetical protein
VNDATPMTRRRMPYWIGIAALILLFPAIVVPLLVRTSGELPFSSIDQIDTSTVRSLEILVIERPDGGPNIGQPNQLFAIPRGDFEGFLATLRHSGRVASESPRGIWLGRLVVTLDDGRAQSIMLHRPKAEYDAAKPQRLELRIGPHQYDGPNVNDFIAHVAKIAGLPAENGN